MAPTLHRIALSGATALIAALLLPVPAAHAVPVFSESDMDTFWNGNNAGPTACTVTDDTGSPSVNDKPVAENGTPTSGSQTSTGTLTNDGDATDVMTWSSSMTGTDRVTTRKGNLDTMSLVSTGALSITSTKPVSACVLRHYNGVDLDFTFTVTKAGFLDATLSSKSHAYGEFYVEADDETDRDFEIYTDEIDGSASGRVYLTPGVYQGFIEGDAVFQGSKATTASPKIAVSATFHLPGSRIGKVTGKGKKYTVLPSARACPQGKTKVKITSNKGRSVLIEQVQYYVNDKMVKETGNRGPGSSVQLKGAADQDVAVRAVTTLTNGKVIEAQASYVACTT